MDGYWERVAERGKDDSPYRAAFAQIIAVADTDAEAEGLYAEHILYFFNRCLHVSPAFADPPGYRTIKTIKAGALAQLSARRQAALHRADVEGPRRRRHRHRRQPRDGAPAHGGDDQDAARRPRVLPAPHRQPAGLRRRGTPPSCSPRRSCRSCATCGPSGRTTTGGGSIRLDGATLASGGRRPIRTTRVEGQAS